jgi:hypothetical protein
MDQKIITVALSGIALLCSMDMHAMDNDDLPPITINQVSKEDRDEAVEYTRLCKMHVINPTIKYRENRVKIAKAVSCGKYFYGFFRAALSEQDASLLDIILHNNKGHLNREESGRPMGGLAIYRAQSVRMAEVLVRHGASMTMVGTESLLRNVCRQPWCPADLLSYYIQHTGLSVNDARNERGNAPIHDLMAVPIAVGDRQSIYRTLEKLKILVEHGADLTIKNAEGKTPLDLVKDSRDRYPSYWKDCDQAKADHDRIIKEMCALMEKDKSVDRPIKPASQAMENSECSICLEEITWGSALACKHVFHEKCVSWWLEVSGTCPTCRYMPQD